LPAKVTMLSRVFCGCSSHSRTTDACIAPTRPCSLISGARSVQIGESMARAHASRTPHAGLPVPSVGVGWWGWPDTMHRTIAHVGVTISVMTHSLKQPLPAFGNVVHIEYSRARVAQYVHTHCPIVQSRRRSLNGTRRALGVNDFAKPGDRHIVCECIACLRGMAPQPPHIPYDDLLFHASHAHAIMAACTITPVTTQESRLMRAA